MPACRARLKESIHPTVNAGEQPLTAMDETHPQVVDIDQSSQSVERIYTRQPQLDEANPLSIEQEILVDRCAAHSLLVPALQSRRAICRMLRRLEMTARYIVSGR